MSTAAPAEPAATSKIDILALRCVILGVAFACLAEFWYANSHTDDFGLQFPAFTPRLWNFYLTLKLACVVALIGIWNWHRWGLKLLTGAGVAMLFLEFYAVGSYSPAFLITSLRIALVLAAIWYLSQRVANRFA